MGSFLRKLSRVVYVQMFSLESDVTVLSRQMPLLAPALPVHRSVQYELLKVRTAE